MDHTIQDMIQSKAQAARDAMRNLCRASVDVRNGALLAMADSILAFKDKIREANQIDLENGQKTGLAEPLMKRLLVDEKKIARMADNLRQVAGLPDPIGEMTRMWERPNGLRDWNSPCTARCRWCNLRVASRRNRRSVGFVRQIRQRGYIARRVGGDTV